MFHWVHIYIKSGPVLNQCKIRGPCCPRKLAYNQYNFFLSSPPIDQSSWESHPHFLLYFGNLTNSNTVTNAPYNHLFSVISYCKKTKGSHYNFNRYLGHSSIYYVIGHKPHCWFPYNPNYGVFSFVIPSVIKFLFLFGLLLTCYIVALTMFY